MRILLGNEGMEALEYIAQSVEVARNATCERSRCGSIIVKENQIIGSGFNSPPQEDETQRRCSYSKKSYHPKITDKTCCIHAEQRAIMDALRNNPDEIVGSRLYFIRLDKENKPQRAGKPYCTICSKMALDAGIIEFVLWHEEGICVYETREYNDLSFRFERG
jgi:deoxycytidylate deaminase